MLVERTGASAKQGSKLQRRQTIGAVQGRQYRNAFQHLHNMFWPTRETYRTRLAHPNDELYEQRPIIPRADHLQRSPSSNETKVSKI